MGSSLYNSLDTKRLLSAASIQFLPISRYFHLVRPVIIGCIPHSYSETQNTILIISVAGIFHNIHIIISWSDITHFPTFNLFPLIPACTARPGLPLSPPEIAFLESPYYRPQTASTSIADRHHPKTFIQSPTHKAMTLQAGYDNDHK